MMRIVSMLTFETRTCVDRSTFDTFYYYMLLSILINEQKLIPAFGWLTANASELAENSNRKKDFVSEVGMLLCARRLRKCKSENWYEMPSQRRHQTKHYPNGMSFILI